MNDDILFVILKKGADKGLFNSVDITKEFRSVLTRDGVDQGLPINWQNTPDLFLSSLQRLNFINYSKFINVGDDLKSVPANWPELINVSISIQPEGLIFLYKKIEMDELIRSNRLGKKNIFATLLLAILSFGLSVYTVIKESIGSVDKPHTHKVTPPPHNQKIVQIPQKVLPNQKPFPLDSSRKP